MSSPSTSNRLEFVHASAFARTGKKPLFVMWSPKIRREVRLCNEREQKAWLLIESDPAITRFCEYPCHYDKQQKTAVVTFWVERSERTEFWLVEHFEGHFSTNALAMMSDFVAWAAKHETHIRVVTRQELQDRFYLIENWSYIVRTAVIWERDITERYTSAIEHLVRDNGSISLGALTSHLDKLDGAQVEATVLYMIQKGRLTCPDLHSVSLSDHSRICTP